MCNASHKNPNKYTDVKITFVDTMYHNSDMFESTLVILMELIIISKAHMKTDGLFSTVKFVHKILYIL